MTLRKSLLLATICASTAVLATALTAHAAPAPTPVGAVTPVVSAIPLVEDNVATATPIKHLVIIYDENVSFDHYFGTYPNATNPTGEPAFTAPKIVPTVNGLTTALLNNNPNAANAANDPNAINPFRLDRSQAASGDQDHNYTPEQQAEDNGAADLFPKFTGTGTSGASGAFGTPGLVMGYYDGNTVTAMWNYAARYAMSDDMRTDTYGPSTPGAVEVVAGQTNGFEAVVNTANKTSNFVSDGHGGFTLINDIDPANDVCSSTTDTGMINAKNIGDLLNQAKITWGGFMGGFNLKATNANGTTGCGRATDGIASPTGVADYVPHHNWFQYFPSTANYDHARPASLYAVGYTFDHSGAADAANHQYDLGDFYAAVKAGNFPSVSYIKLPAYRDGHAGYSDPLDEQQGVVEAINFIEAQPDWKNTAIIVTYDDSDGWYDHSYATPTRSSFDPAADQLNGNGTCGTGTQPIGVAGQPVNGRCGPGVRVPFLVISPYAKSDYVDHTPITQASVVRFIEDNWLHGTRLGGGSFDADNSTGSIMSLFDFSTAHTVKTLLNPVTGQY